jgi:dUTP pyrophosphatase
LGPVTIKAKGHGRINTGISVEVPIGLEVQVRPRSGLAAKNGVFSHFGTVDSDYRGEVGVILFNLGDSDFVVNHGDRIAQIAVCGVGVMPINVVGSLSDTSRGSGGFGSTGV